MGFWSRLTGTAGITANENPPGTPPTVGGGDYTPGDPDGVTLEGEETFSRALPFPQPSPWDGWPGDWLTPTWDEKLQKLVDTAWAALDLNSSVLASMPVYQLRSGRVEEPLSWLSNPDPLIYSSWEEFAKQLFWDYQGCGEAFVVPTEFFAGDRPKTFRVIPPWFVSIEMDVGHRRYYIGGREVTDDILHIRYRSTTMDARGHGPLEVSNARIVAAGVLSRYVQEFVKTGGTPEYWIGVEQRLSRADADELLAQWLESRRKNFAKPAVLTGGAKLNQTRAQSAKDMALVELAQYTDSRIAVMLGVPPFLLGLPSGGDPLTYSSISSLFDFHVRSSLNPKASAVMAALSGWALPRGHSVELNRDEYIRPPLLDRAQAYEKLFAMGAISVDEIRAAERLRGDASDAAASVLTGDDE